MHAWVHESANDAWVVFIFVFGWDEGKVSGANKTDCIQGGMGGGTSDILFEYVDMLSVLSYGLLHDIGGRFGLYSRQIAKAGRHLNWQHSGHCWGAVSVQHNPSRYDDSFGKVIGAMNDSRLWCSPRRNQRSRNLKHMEDKALLISSQYRSWIMEGACLSWGKQGSSHWFLPLPCRSVTCISKWKIWGTDQE